MTFYGMVHSNIFPANTSPAEGNEALSALKGSVTQSVMSKCCTIWPFCFMSLVGIRETFRAADSASYSLYFAAGGTGLSDAGVRAASSPRHPRHAPQLPKCHQSGDCSQQALSLLLMTNTAIATVLWHSG